MWWFSSAPMFFSSSLFFFPFVLFLFLWSGAFRLLESPLSSESGTIQFKMDPKGSLCANYCARSSSLTPLLGMDYKQICFQILPFFMGRELNNFLNSSSLHLLQPNLYLKVDLAKILRSPTKKIVHWVTHHRPVNSKIGILEEKIHQLRDLVHVNKRCQPFG